MVSLAGDSNRTRVLLMNMPWGPVSEPCIGLGILKSVLRKRGICCDVIDAPMRLLRYIKPKTYNWIASAWAAADFVFTREFEEEVSPEQLEALAGLVQDTQGCVQEVHRELESPEPDVEKFLRVRQEVIPRFMDDLMAEVDFTRYCLVGFSCLFDQTFASLALARRIKRAHPDLMIAFGGYALHRPVGPALQRCFSEMDVVAYGDGEPVIVPLWEAAQGLRPLSEVPNISYRDAAGLVVDKAPAVKIDMDDSPAPDYDDFFRQREQLRDRHKVTIPVGEVHVESSRGCWYGAKSHCTFCGIDDETLKYRVKSAAVTLAQMDQLHHRYGVTVFRFSDYIMPLRYYQDFLPELARRGAPYSIHYETKANLKQTQIEVCARAGIRYLQPGIESFSTPVLKLMDKGVSAAQNVFTLFTMLRHRIISFYNLIFGFPGEKPEDYQPMVELLPSLYHLLPPVVTVPVLMTRYAPLAEDPERFGVKGPLKAHWRYGVVFSRRFYQERGLAPGDYCYYFDNPYREFSPELKLYHEALQHQVLKWRDRHFTRKARLMYAEEGEGMVVRDTRFRDEPEVHRLGRAHRLLGEILCEQFLDEPRLLRQAAAAGLSDAEVRAALGDLTDARVVLRVDGHYVWVALHESWVERAASYYGAPRLNPVVRSSSEWTELANPIADPPGRKHLAGREALVPLTMASAP